MSQSNDYFCWVRLVKLTGDVRRAARETTLLLTDGLGPYKGPRPPSPMVRATQSDSCKSDDPVGVWSVHPVADGLDLRTSSFDYGPAFDDAGEALSWLGAPDGKAWDAGAEDRFLMHFRLSNERLAKPVAKRVAGGDMPSQTPNGGVGFQPNDWQPELRELWWDNQHDLPVGEATFGAHKVTIRPPESYLSPEEDKRQLLERTLERKNRHEEICVEAASGINVAARLFQVIGVALDRPLNVDVRTFCVLLLEALESPINTLKSSYRRRRPWHEIPEVRPLFDAGHLLHPQHPSFPAGHATIAQVFAGLLAHLYPAHEEALQNAANEIAKNREIAGLHFHSDTLAGQDLGRQIAGVLVQGLNSESDTLPAGLKQLLSRAKASFGRVDR